jgi:fused signal recognition particle receptor
VEIVLLVLVLVLVLGGVAYVVASRRGTREELEPGPETDELEAAVTAAPVVPKASFRDRLGKARAGISRTVGGILGRSGIDRETWDDLEAGLLQADVGVTTTTRVLDRLKARVDEEKVEDPEALVAALKEEVRGCLDHGADRSLCFDEPTPDVWLFVGVNGAGKTTTIGKLAKQQAALGRRVVLAGGDTFRAAAGEQLQMWGDRAGVDVVRGMEGGDPAAVIHDGVERAAARGSDLVLADTAGRLHTKSNLMDELRKVRRVADREPGRVTEVLLVLDATVGQNGLVQARQFTEAVEVTGVVLTKLDGSAKGGIVLAVEAELGIPVKLVGLGEGADDLIVFDPDEFVEALFA